MSGDSPSHSTVGVRTLAVPHYRASLFHKYVGIGVKRDLKKALMRTVIVYHRVIMCRRTIILGTMSFLASVTNFGVYRIGASISGVEYKNYSIIKPTSLNFSIKKLNQSTYLLVIAVRLQRFQLYT